MSLESLHRLSLTLGASLDRTHECSVFVDWLKAEAQPRLIALFVAEPGRESLRLIAASGFKKTPSNALPLGHDPWEWLKAQNIPLPRGEKYALPITLEGELFGLLAVISMQKGDALNEEQRLLDLALAYLAPILRNIEKHESVERLVEERTAQLRQSEERYRSLVNSLPELIYAISPEGKITFLNPAFEQITGWPVAAWLGRSFEDLIHPDDRPLLRERFARALKTTHTETTIEVRIHTASGKLRILEVLGVAQMEDSRVIGVTGYGRDITEHKQDEEALRESEERFRALAQSTSTAIFVYSGEKFIYANRATEELTGYSASELLNVRFWDVVHPDFQEMVRQRGLARQRGEDVPSRYEFKIVRKDGEERWIDFTAGKIDWHGQPAAIGSAVDITERKQAEEALRASEERFRAYIERASDYIFSLDPQGRFTFVNQAMCLALGYHPGELLGQPALTVVSPEARQEASQVLQRIWSGETVDSMDLPVQTRQGKTLLVQIRGRGFYRDGQLVETLHIARDVTLQKQAEEAIKNSERRLSALIANGLDFISILDAQGNLLWESPSTNTLLGYRFNEFLGRSILELVHPEDLEWVQRQFAEVASKPGSRQAGMFRLRTAGNEYRWVEAVASNFLDDPAVGGIVINYRDITERKRHEREIQAEAMLAQALGETLELQPLLERLLEAARHAIPAAEKGSILLVEANGRLRIRALSGYTDPRLNEFTFASDSGYSARAARERKPLLIADVRADDSIRYDGEIEEARQIHSAIAAPLLIREQVIGVIALDSTQKNAFSEEDLALLSAFATPTALIIQNARLFEETRRRAEETASLLESSLALSSLDLQTTLQTIGERAKALFQADGCRIFLLEPDGQSLRCVLALQENQAAFLGLTIPLGQGVTGQVALTGEAEIVNDMLHDPRAVQVPGTNEEPEALMFAPLKEGDRTIGVISIRRVGTERPFQPDDLDLLKAFAALAASAVANAHLYAEAQQRLRELETLQAVSSALRQARSVEEMLPIFVQHAARAVGAQAGSIYLLDENSGDWVSQSWVTAEGSWLATPAEMRHRPGEGVTGLVGESGIPYITSDWRSDPTNKPLSGELGFIENFRSGISLPLPAESRVIGVMHIWYREAHTFSENEKRLLTAIADMAGSAIQRARLHDETERRVEQLQSLQAIDQAITASLDPRVSLNILLEHTIHHLGVDAAGVLLMNPALHFLEYAAGRGFRTRHYERTSLRLGEGKAGRVALERRTWIIPDLSLIPITRKELIQGEGFVSYLAAPLLAKGQVKGVLEIFHRSPFSPTVEQMRFFEALAQQAAIAIENGQLFESLQRANLELSLAYDKTIEGWSRALDLRDRETEGHTQRVTALTIQLAQAMGLSEEQIMHLRRGALLHDIGKMGVPDHILFKEGSLTPEEWAIMRQHPQFAYEMLSSIEYLRPALEIPWCHHEKWDGSGYPRGLKGEQIPLAARIFAIADVFDALTSDRPYHKAWPIEQALQYIRQQAGSHFDPQIVEIFLNMNKSLLGDSQPDKD